MATIKRNQFGEEVTEEKSLTPDDWNERWKQEKTKFHMKKIHPTLQKYFNDLVGEDGSKCKSFLVPLCGKTLDMNWLASLGHRVVGVECSSLGCEQFFEENNIPYECTKETTIPNCTLYKSTDSARNVSIFCCDFFSLKRSHLGAFDCIWDRGSFAAIDLDLRKKYVNVMKDFLGSHTRYLLCAFSFDNSRFAGPPFPTSVEEVNDFYGDKCCVKLLGDRDCFTDWQREWGLDAFIEITFLLTLA